MSAKHDRKGSTGRRGPAPLTPEQHRLRGTPDTHKLGDSIIQPELQKAPEPPPELNAEAMEEWHKIIPLLQLQGLLAYTDHAALSTYCSAWAHWRSVTRTLNAMRERDKAAEGNVLRGANGRMVKNPAVEMQITAQRHLMEAARALGLTHESRIRLRVDAKGLEVNPFAANDYDMLN